MRKTKNRMETVAELQPKINRGTGTETVYLNSNKKP
jgi:hypothetical protein